MSNVKTITFDQFCEYCMYRGVELRTRKNLCTNLKSEGNGEISSDSCPRWKEVGIGIAEPFADIIANATRPDAEAEYILEENIDKVI